MSDDAPDRLSPELEAFLAPERRCPEPPADVQRQVLSSIGVTLGWGGGPGSGSGGSDPPGGAPPGGHGGGGVLAGPGAAKHLLSGSLAKTVATLIVGGVIGSGVHEVYDRASDRRAARAKVAAVAPSVVAAPAPAAAAPPEPVPAPAPTPSAGVRDDSPRPRPERVARVEPQERDRSLAAERALIEQARTALARDHSAAALAVLERHARDFPQGELDEERESLQVQALVAQARYEQARKVAARFHRRFPRSIFGAVVDEALQSIP